jgi:hypothetical protein
MRASVATRWKLTDTMAGRQLGDRVGQEQARELGDGRHRGQDLEHPLACLPVSGEVVLAA